MRVTFVFIPFSLKILTAFSPSGVIGTLIVIFGAIFANSSPSVIISCHFVAITSALTEPDTTSVISFKRSSNEIFSFATRLGFVVTPANTPKECTSFISLRFAVSMKNFISFPSIM